VPASKHVFVVVEENHSYSSVVGNSSMPYFNSLANRYGLATNYYANTHPSIGNYFMMTTGQIITNNDGYASVVTADNIVRRLLSAGKTWKSYAESLPSVGYTGGNTGSYLKRHNPFAYFSDVANSSMEKLNLVPFTQFSKDLTNNTLPEFSFIVPNACNDAHDCSLSTADNWLKANIDPLINSATFQQDGILVIVFDESTSSDTAHGGGHIAAIVVSPKAKLAFKSTTFYQHQSLLKMVMSALGLTSFPGAAATASNMSEFFGSTTPTTPTTPNFTLTTSPSLRTIKRGASTTYSVALRPSGGFNSKISFGLSGQPAGSTASFSSTTLTGSGSTILTVRTSRAKSALGTFRLTVKGTGGGLTRYAYTTLTVTK
jgi:hypothetical protein